MLTLFRTDKNTIGIILFELESGVMLGVVIWGLSDLDRRSVRGVIQGKVIISDPAQKIRETPTIKMVPFDIKEYVRGGGGGGGGGAGIIRVISIPGKCNDLTLFNE